NTEVKPTSADGTATSGRVGRRQFLLKVSYMNLYETFLFYIYTYTYLYLLYHTIAIKDPSTINHHLLLMLSI
ncbi:hypothetical protein, partial [Chryseobacterium sp. LAM-KRS1]|uniref:hypothetical protein n=1 Tax=Chryseobacterium sp. LAM-KRS1 TaxID=2715754 RepID=UPI001E30C464